MSYLKRRNRLVSFRLSEEEYEQLNRACIAAGARSISDFARSALQRSVVREDGAAAPNSTQELIDSMKDLSRRLTFLVGLTESNRNMEN